MLHSHQKTLKRSKAAASEPGAKGEMCLETPGDVKGTSERLAVFSKLELVPVQGLWLLEASSQNHIRGMTASSSAREWSPENTDFFFCFFFSVVIHSMSEII